VPLSRVFPGADEPTDAEALLFGATSELAWGARSEEGNSRREVALNCLLNAPGPDVPLRPSVLAGSAPPLAADVDEDDELPPSCAGAGHGGHVIPLGAAPPGPPLGPAFGLAIPRTALGVLPVSSRGPPPSLGHGRPPRSSTLPWLVRAENAFPAFPLGAAPLRSEDEAPLLRFTTCHSCRTPPGGRREGGRGGAQPESEAHPVKRKLMQRSRSGLEGLPTRRSTKARFEAGAVGNLVPFASANFR